MRRQHHLPLTAGWNSVFAKRCHFCVFHSILDLCNGRLIRRIYFCWFSKSEIGLDILDIIVLSQREMLVKHLLLEIVLSRTLAAKRSSIHSQAVAVRLLTLKKLWNIKVHICRVKVCRIDFRVRNRHIRQWKFFDRSDSPINWSSHQCPKPLFSVMILLQTLQAIWIFCKGS